MQQLERIQHHQPFSFHVCLSHDLQHCVLYQLAAALTALGHEPIANVWWRVLDSSTTGSPSMMRGRSSPALIGPH